MGLNAKEKDVIVRADLQVGPYLTVFITNYQEVKMIRHETVGNEIEVIIRTGGVKDIRYAIDKSLVCEELHPAVGADCYRVR